jgi:alkylated DNA repair dioxygenase AlkB
MSLSQLFKQGKIKETITITCGDQAENHVGMEKIGQLAQIGFTVAELEKLHKTLPKTELIKLNDLLDDVHLETEDPESAAILIIRNGVNLMLGPKSEEGVDELYIEQAALNWDTKCKMYGRVCNKKARHNLCYSVKAQEPNYENGKGRIISFDDVPILRKIMQALPQHLGIKAENLVAEGNRYYDVNKCFIGWHGDTERRIVIGIRLGATFPLMYQWYRKGSAVGAIEKLLLHHGDIYIMSSKAVGFDWKKRNIYTLRHSAKLS